MKVGREGWENQLGTKSERWWLPSGALGVCEWRGGEGRGWGGEGGGGGDMGGVEGVLSG